MANEWYYAKSGQRHGPVNDQQLKELAELGQLGQTDLVWCERMSDWKAASTIKGLFSGQRRTGPPPLPRTVQEKSDVPNGKAVSVEPPQSPSSTPPSGTSSQESASAQQRGTTVPEPKWFVLRDGNEDGPYTRKQLQELASGGQLAPSNLVRREKWGGQMGDWKQAQDVWGLFSSTASEPKGGPSFLGTSETGEAVDTASQQPSVSKPVAEVVPEEQQKAEAARQESEECENWYYSQGGKQFGPITFGRLFEVAASGQLKPQDMVTREGAKWCFAGQFLLAFSPEQRPPEVSDQDQWYYNSQGRQVGPVSFRQLAALALTGGLRPNDSVGRTGTNWVLAGALLSAFSQPKQQPQFNLGDAAMWGAVLFGSFLGLLFSAYSGKFLLTITVGAACGFLLHLLSTKWQELRAISLERYPFRFIGALCCVLLLLCIVGPLGRRGSEAESDWSPSVQTKEDWRPRNETERKILQHYQTMGQLENLKQNPDFYYGRDLGP